MSSALTASTMLAAVLIDWLLGEPKRWHPLVAYGRLATQVERGLYGSEHTSTKARRVRGAAAVALLVLPLTLFVALLASIPVAGVLVSVLALYFALGHRSLHDHARPVAQALRAGDDAGARAYVSLMVSRDSAALNAENAATESVLENGNDGVFGALFWFILLGAPGAVLYRLANTLDAMWGYRNKKYLYFGWAAARFDDLINYIPARLTALTYAALGQTGSALRCWRLQAPLWDSPNAGPVMAAGAGALGVILGGPARYQGEWHERPLLGKGRFPVSADIERALSLVRHGVILWLVILFLVAGLFYV